MEAHPQSLGVVAVAVAFLCSFCSLFLRSTLSFEFSFFTLSGAYGCISIPPIITFHGALQLLQVVARDWILLPSLVLGEESARSTSRAEYKCGGITLRRKKPDRSWRC